MYKRPIDSNSPNLLSWLPFMILLAGFIVQTYTLHENEISFEETYARQEELIDKQKEVIREYKKTIALKERLIQAQNLNITWNTQMLKLYREKYAEATTSR